MLEPRAQRARRTPAGRRLGQQPGQLAAHVRPLRQPGQSTRPTARSPPWSTRGLPRWSRTNSTSGHRSTSSTTSVELVLPHAQVHRQAVPGEQAGRRRPGTGRSRSPAARPAAGAGHPTTSGAVRTRRCELGLTAAPRSRARAPRRPAGRRRRRASSWTHSTSAPLWSARQSACTNTCPAGSTRVSEASSATEVLGQEVALQRRLAPVQPRVVEPRRSQKCTWLSTRAGGVVPVASSRRPARRAPGPVNDSLEVGDVVLGHHLRAGVDRGRHVLAVERVERGLDPHAAHLVGELGHRGRLGAGGDGGQLVG